LHRLTPSNVSTPSTAVEITPTAVQIVVHFSQSVPSSAGPGGVADVDRGAGIRAVDVDPGAGVRSVDVDPGAGVGSVAIGSVTGVGSVAVVFCTRVCRYRSWVTEPYP
jgi:hypothetical protein